MKKLYRLEHADKKMSSFFLEIIGEKPDNKPYVTIHDDVQSFFIPEDQLELIAVNILKALKSKKLKS